LAAFTARCRSPAGPCRTVRVGRWKSARDADNEGVSNDRIITIHWKRVLFSAALFWFWYLTPSLAAYVVQAKALEPLAALLGR
jgi:hypothetical protein